MSDLATKSCIPCQGGVPPLEGDELRELQEQLGGDWEVIEGHHLHKTWGFSDFKEALAFVNKVGELAEQEGHHPDFKLSYGRVEISMHTHKIDGLTESDFVMAAKIDQLGNGSL